MTPVEPRDITYVLAVNEAKGFSRAAEKYYISQPALRKAVRKVEQNLGVTLFDRRSVPLTPTAEGIHILSYFQRIQDLQQELAEYCTALRNQAKTDIRIGAPSFFCTYILPPMIADFQLEHPRASIRLIESNDSDLRRFLPADVVDIGISVESDMPAEFASFVLQEERIILAVPRSFPVNSGLQQYSAEAAEVLSGAIFQPDFPCVPMSAFAHERFLLLKKGNDLYQRGLQVCQDAGFTPNIVMELDQLMTAYYLADAGRGITFIRAGLPYYAGDPQRLVFYKIDHPGMVRPVRVFHDRTLHLSPIQASFVTFMQNYSMPI